MFFTDGRNREFERMMQQRPGFGREETATCSSCRHYRPKWKYQYCKFEECPYCPGRMTALPDGKPIS